MKTFLFEYYTKCPETGEGGYEIKTGWLQAASEYNALGIISHQPHFDRKISLYEANMSDSDTFAQLCHFDVSLCDVTPGPTIWRNGGCFLTLEEALQVGRAAMEETNGPYHITGFQVNNMNDTNSTMTGERRCHREGFFPPYH